MIINLQPHAVNLPNTKIEPSGKLARVQENLVEADNHPLANELPIFIQNLGKATVDNEPFPSEQTGTYYIVSLMVAQALPGRNDLLVPVGQLRDTTGKIIGCTGLAVG